MKKLFVIALLFTIFMLLVPPIALASDFDDQIDAGGDDTYWKSTTFYGTANYLRVCQSSDAEYNLSLRFDPVTIPASATIDACTIELYGYVVDATSCYADIYGNDVEDAVAPTDLAEAQALVTTTAKVDWDNFSETHDTWAETPELKTIVQELVNSYDYSGGDHAMQFMIYDDTVPEHLAYFYSYEGNSSYSAKLHIDYTETADPPTVDISAGASSITAHTARLNGEITDDGDDPDNVTVVMYWGDNDGGSNPASWDFTSAPDSPAQPQGEAVFYLDVDSLDSDTTYYYNAKATNDNGTAWGTTENFNTLIEILPPINFTATIDGNNVDLEWEFDGDGDTVVIIRGTSDYPTTIDDGVEVYNSTGTSYTDEGIVDETTTFYYSAWGYDTGETAYSTTYTTADTGGEMSAVMLLGILVLLALAPTIASLITKQEMLAIVSAMGWFLLGAYGLGNTEATWDTYYTLGFFSIFMGIFMMLAGSGLYFIRRRNNRPAPEENWGVDEPLRQSILQEKADTDRMNKIMGKPRKKKKKAQRIVTLK